MSMKDLFEDENFLLAVLGIFSFTIIISFIIVGVKKTQEHSSPSYQKFNLKVIAKDGSPHQFNSNLIIYSITFESSDGSRISLNAPNRETYNCIVIGDIVDVEYRGEKLISFTRKK